MLGSPLPGSPDLQGELDLLRVQALWQVLQAGAAVGVGECVAAAAGPGRRRVGVVRHIWRPVVKTAELSGADVTWATCGGARPKGGGAAVCRGLWGPGQEQGTEQAGERAEPPSG